MLRMPNIVLAEISLLAAAVLKNYFHSGIMRRNVQMRCFGISTFFYFNVVSTRGCICVLSFYGK